MRLRSAHNIYGLNLSNASLERWDIREFSSRTTTSLSTFISTLYAQKQETRAEVRRYYFI